VIVPCIRELSDRPNLIWNEPKLFQPLAAVRHRQGRLIGHKEALGFPLREEAVLHALTEDVLESSQIEGEVLDREQVRSSIAGRLGMEIGGLVEADRDVEGPVEMMLDATQNYAQPRTAERLLRLACSLISHGDEAG
jgi:Fic family protein